METVIKENYNKNLTAVEYNKDLIAMLHAVRHHFQHMLTFIYDVVKSKRFQGQKLLEIGSGATVHNIASASAYFTNIVQSDLVLDNLEKLKGWHSGQTTLDWSEFLDMVVKLEGLNNGGRALLELRIRKNVRAVVRSDVLTESVLPLEQLTAPETAPPYDLIIAVLCLEAASPDYDAYVKVLKRLNKLLRKGGGVIICGYENAGPWTVFDQDSDQHKTFNHVTITLKEHSRALDLAGFGNHEIKNYPRDEHNWYYTYDSVYCIASEKL